jgi:hypothetical protein
MNLFWGIFWGTIAQILIFLQIQGSLKYQFLQDHKFWVLMMGAPISWIFMASVKNLVAWGDGQIWPSRLIGFSIGIIVFSVLSIILFGEGVTLKTGVCLFLSALILGIQIFWK